MNDNNNDLGTTVWVHIAKLRQLKEIHLELINKNILTIKNKEGKLLFCKGDREYIKTTTTNLDYFIKNNSERANEIQFTRNRNTDSVKTPRGLL